MPSRREMIRMTDEEMWAFIETQKSVQVATLSKTGWPHLTTLWFAVVDGAVVLETFSKSQKIKNLQRDQRITILLEDGQEYNELRGVSIQAEAELVTDVDEVHRLHMAVLKRNTPEIDEAILEEATASMAHKKTAVLVRPGKVISWDHRKLDVSY